MSEEGRGGGVIGGIVCRHPSSPGSGDTRERGLTGDPSRAAVLVNVLFLAHRNGFHVRN